MQPAYTAKLRTAKTNLRLLPLTAPQLSHSHPSLNTGTDAHKPPTPTLCAAGNINTFLAAADAAHRMGGGTALGVVFSAALGAGRSAQLAASIGSSVALVGAGSQLAQALGEGYALAVNDLVGR